MQRTQSEFPKDTNITTIQQLFKTLGDSSDFVRYPIHESDNAMWVSFFRTMLDGNIAQRDFLPYLKEAQVTSLEELQQLLPLEVMEIISDLEKIQLLIVKGYAAVQLREYDERFLLVKVSSDTYRTSATAINESTIVGPQEAFIEDIDTNIKLVRKRLPLPYLKTTGLDVGTISKTNVVVMYLDGIADPVNVQTILQKLQAITFDQILDSSYIEQMLEDNTHSIFPLFMNTERPDRVASALGAGKVAIFVDGSPSVIMAPTTFLDFFVSTEDYNVSWIIGTSFRLLRLIALIFSVFATPLYVAIMTFHYELIPRDLLQTLISSRSTVPFPPFLEALFLEVIIELLREASTRLPVKIGQSLGVVGGIVVGQATVQAGLSSNILIIFVALSALSAFTSPLYKVGFTIRFIRFLLLVLAQAWGMLGIAIGFLFIVTHMLRLSSLGRPYTGVVPFRKQHLLDTWIRLPFFKQTKRTSQTSSPHPNRTTVEDYSHLKPRTDFDEW
ncbi:spore germination protein [Ectobacillus sp. JY-23]|uniref:spore germination protein n=1 Tax=Ectobacillus sp. JY-23 TaxID=2933872 RepID=UPI001FF16839|nr:spore germination protein [Ectobacillus sp. JY-23]UOY92964.1 spore germination protein [Ectobacillus sp. JY-23]